MIIFDEYRYVVDIMRNGIDKNDNHANYKLYLVARHLIENTTYKPKDIKNNLKRYAKEYFYGLSEAIIDKEIDLIYDKAKTKEGVEEKKGTNDLEEDNKIIDFTEAIDYFVPRTVTLYENEMKRISELDKNLQELAFVFLVVHKFQGYKWTYECNADIYKLCHWDEKGKGKNQNTKDMLIHKLVEDEVISFYCATNKKYSRDKSWIAKTYFSVLINEDLLEEEKRSPVWNTITNYDDILLYWRLYQGDENLKLCKKCNAPIENTGNAKKFCSNCELENIRESKRKSKEKTKLAG